MLFEIDTGASISAISKEKLDQIGQLKYLLLIKTPRKFQSYQGSVMTPLGVLKVDAKHRHHSERLDLYVFGGRNKPIIGRDWIKTFDLIAVNMKPRESIYFISSREKYVRKLLNA
ncbi:Protein of unknown function [Cotesia congregata]|uniref:Peptidase A2 domain-containing protein n=1 Tax=Cotesia congregata TaxID=51543 RepID=A0A8J2HNQ9_COTCN|nr:Protein of unknown function [Cotesia congregata]